MAQPKKQKSSRKTGFGRNHLLEKLRNRVNAHSPVKARTTSANKKALAKAKKAE
jgi:hypothetical protein